MREGKNCKVSDTSVWCRCDLLSRTRLGFSSFRPSSAEKLAERFKRSMEEPLKYSSICRLR